MGCSVYHTPMKIIRLYPAVILAAWTIIQSGPIACLAAESTELAPAAVSPDSPPAEPTRPVSSMMAELFHLPATSLVEQLNLKGLWEDNSRSDWLMLLGAVMTAFVVGRIVGIALRRIGRRLDVRGFPARAQVLGDLIGPVQLVIVALGLTVGLADLTMTGAARTFCAKTLLLIYTVAVLWFVYNLVDIIDLFARRYVLRRESFLDQHLAPLLRKSMRVLLVVVGTLYIIEAVFDRDIGAWLAGLGIAGLAVSLAAQDSLRNLFGSLTVLFDRPFAIGDRVIVGTYDGTVEEIGFRSTKLRTAAGHLITIPNLTIVNTSIENVSRRTAIRRAFTLTLAHDTSSQSLAKALDALRAVFAEDAIRGPIEPVLDGQQQRPAVEFTEQTLDGLLVSITYFYALPDAAKYSAHAEQVNLRLRAALEAAGVKLASRQAAMGK